MPHRQCKRQPRAHLIHEAMYQMLRRGRPFRATDVADHLYGRTEGAQLDRIMSTVKAYALSGLIEPAKRKNKRPGWYRPSLRTDFTENQLHIQDALIGRREMARIREGLLRDWLQDAAVKTPRVAFYSKTYAEDMAIDAVDSWLT